MKPIRNTDAVKREPATPVKKTTLVIRRSRGGTSARLTHHVDSAREPVHFRYPTVGRSAEAPSSHQSSRRVAGAVVGAFVAGGIGDPLHRARGTELRRWPA